VPLRYSPPTLVIVSGAPDAAPVPCSLFLNRKALRAQSHGKLKIAKTLGIGTSTVQRILA
jgi:hypothetical protein